jgi:hypothetical protein
VWTVSPWARDVSDTCARKVGSAVDESKVGRNRLGPVRFSFFFFFSFILLSLLFLSLNLNFKFMVNLYSISEYVI